MRVVSLSEVSLGIGGRSESLGDAVWIVMERMRNRTLRVGGEGPQGADRSFRGGRARPCRETRTAHLCSLNQFAAGGAFSFTAAKGDFGWL